MKCLGEIFDYPDNFCLCGHIFQIFRYFAINDFNISTSVLLFRIISLSSYAVLALSFDPVRNKHRVFTRYAHTFHEKISFLAVLLFHTLSFFQGCRYESWSPVLVNRRWTTRCEHEQRSDGDRDPVYCLS